MGSPPASIGKFGGDTDNWMWPRHTGDFSIFRIYAGKNNEPAPYSKDNVPYKPKSFLPISLKGYEKNDFTFVFGYPGTTKEYLTSSGVDLIANLENPLRVSLRQKRLDIMQAAMNESRQVRIQYMAKANGIANYWKKMIGESKGIQRVDAVAKKEIFEKQFLEWADADATRKSRYSRIPETLKSTYQQFLPVDLSSIYMTEAGMGVEIIRLAAGTRDLVKLSNDKKTTGALLAKSLESLRRGSAEFYKNWQPAVDRKIMVAMLTEMTEKMNKDFMPQVLKEVSSAHKGAIGPYVEELFAKSIFTDSARFYKFLADYKVSRCKKLTSDPIYGLADGIYTSYETVILPSVNRYNARIDSLQRLYMAGIMEMRKGEHIYPDANGTLRVAFGRVDDYSPADAVGYNYFTTLAGVIQKEDSAIYDYRVDPELKKRYLSHDYGKYADKDGSMHVAFTASNHTTGGNSGSPVLNSSGEMIGINFDRNWEGTLSDLMYDPSQCRNITLDIRYCLFVIDRVYGNSRLISELKLVN